MRRLVILVPLLLLVSVVSAVAQNPPPVIFNPDTVTFTASPDHAKTYSDGQPYVTRYDVKVYAKGAMTTPISTQNIAKPAPDATNKITWTNLAYFAPLGPGELVTTITAVGPGGQAESLPTSPFVNGGPGAPTGAAMSKKSP